MAEDTRFMHGKYLKTKQYKLAKLQSSDTSRSGLSFQGLSTVCQAIIDSRNFKVTKAQKHPWQDSPSMEEISTCASDNEHIERKC